MTMPAMTISGMAASGAIMCSQKAAANRASPKPAAPTTKAAKRPRPVMSDNKIPNRGFFPISLYAMFVVLVALGYVGLIVPLTFLAGFDRSLFQYFAAGCILLCLCIVWLLADLALSNRIRPAADVNFLPHRSSSEDGIMYTVLRR